MAVPTIATVAPAIGHAGGGNLVMITGTDFRLPDLFTGPQGASVGDAAGYEDPPQTVRVLVNGVESPVVFVHSATELVFRPPAYTGSVKQAVYPAVDIVVENLDDDGILIVGETVTTTQAYTYVREALRPPTLTIESPYVRISRALIDLIKRDVLLETGLTTHTDFSVDGAVAADADIPSIFLFGPRVTKEPEISGEDNIPSYDPDPSGDSWDRYPALTMHRFAFDLIVATNSTVELLTLMGVTRKIFRKYPYLELAADVPASSLTKMPMIMTVEPTASFGLSDANLRTFTGTFEVRRVPILSLPTDKQTFKLTELESTLEKIGGAFVETKTIFEP